MLSETISAVAVSLMAGLSAVLFTGADVPVSWETGQPADPIVSALCDLALESEYPLEIVYKEYSPVDGTDDWYIARMDWERDWWGGCRVFRWDGTGIAERAAPAASIDEFEVTGQSVNEVGSLPPGVVEYPGVYVIDRTHQGNRFLYIWCLSDQSELIPMCRARISMNLDGFSYNLDWMFEDCNGDGHADLILQGELTETGETHPSSSSVEKVYLFDQSSTTFLLDMESSIGIGSWDSGDSGFGETGIQGNQE